MNARLCWLGFFALLISASAQAVDIVEPETDATVTGLMEVQILVQNPPKKGARVQVVLDKHVLHAKRVGANLDGESWQAPVRFNLNPGVHVVRVTAQTRAGIERSSARFYVAGKLPEGHPCNSDFACETLFCETAFDSPTSDDATPQRNFMAPAFSAGHCAQPRADGERCRSLTACQSHHCVPTREGFRVCTSDSSASAYCGSDKDCPDDSVCHASRCVQRTARDVDHSIPDKPNDPTYVREHILDHSMLEN